MNRYYELLQHFNYRTHVLFAAFVMASAFLELASLWVLRDLLLMLFVSSGSPPAAFANFSSSWLPQLPLPQTLAYAFAFFLFKNVLLFALWRSVINRLGEEQHDFSVRLFARYLRMPYLRYVDQSKMTLQQNLNIAISDIFVFSILPAMQLAVEATVAGGILVYLLLSSPAATAALVVWIAVVFALFRFAIANTASAAGTLQRKSFGHTLRITMDSLRDVKAIRMWGREDFFSALFGQISAPFARAWSYARLMQQASRFAIEPVLIGSLVVFALALGITGTAAHNAIVDLSVFAAAAVRLLPGAQRSIGLLHTIEFHRADLQEVWTDASLPIERLEARPACGLPPPFLRSMRMSAVTIRYGGAAKPTLKELDIEIGRGEKVGIAGPSGGGKTTLLNTLLGFIPLDTGQVLFDGVADQPLARFRRSAAAFVPQTVFLLDDTVEANIVFGPDGDAVDEARIWHCLQVTDFAEQVRSLPGGLQSRVGEDGIKLSGGERQRLALARALYQQPDFLVLDEATSQLDIATEQRIFARLFATLPGLTLILATHRPESLAMFSRNFWIEDGTARALPPVQRQA